MQFVVTADGSNPVDSSTGGKADPQSTRSLVNDSYDADVGARRGDIGGSGNASGYVGAGARVSPPWGARKPRWPRGSPCESVHSRGDVGKGSGRSGSLVLEGEDARVRGSATAAALVGVQRTNTRSNISGSKNIEVQQGESRSYSDEDQRSPTSSSLRHVEGGVDEIVAGRRKRDRHEHARSGRSLIESRGGGSERGAGTSSTSSTRKTPLAGVAVSADGEVSAGGASADPWSVRWAIDAPMRRGGQCDGPGASGADSSPDSSRQRSNARRRTDGESGVNKEETKSSPKGGRQGERSG